MLLGKKLNQNKRPVSAKPSLIQRNNFEENQSQVSFADGDTIEYNQSQFLLNESMRFNKRRDDELEQRRERYKVQQRKYKQLLAKVSFFDPDIPAYDRKYQYSYDKIMPYVFFFKYLAKKPDGPEDKQKNAPNRLKVWLPDTLVFNDGDLPAMWFYTSQSGHVFRSDSFNKRNISQKFGDNCSPNELVAVIKKPCYRSMELVGNDVNIVSKSELDSVSANLFQDKNQLTIFQRFVKSNGPKAYICRTVWRKDKNPYSWIVTNRLDYKDQSNLPEIKKYVINMQIMNSCTIVESQKGKFVEETVPYLDNIGRYFHIHLGVTFKELIGDFIKDESGVWWLVNIRGFLLDKYEIPINVKSITNYGDMQVDKKKSPFQDISKQKEIYQRVKPCKYCEEIFPAHELTNSLTLKMILQTDKHLQNRGKNFDWLNRTDMKHIDTPMLYQEHRVCTSCYKLYVEIDKLVTVECRFAQQIGIPVTEDNKMNLTSATMLHGFYGTINAPNQSKVNTFIDNPNDKQMPLNWEFNLEPGTEIIVKSDLPLSGNEELNSLNNLCRYRFMVLINSIKDIPIDKEFDKNYYVEYSFFDIKERYKVEMQNVIQKGDDYSRFYVPMNRMRMFYFFASCRKTVNNFINQFQSLQVDLLCENKVIGSVQLELSDFQSDQVIRNEYYKIFSGKDLPLLKWGVSVTLGLIPSGEQNITRVGLREYFGIYLPNSIYYTCEPLPQEWITAISNKPDWDKQPQQNLQKSIVTNKELAILIIIINKIENPNLSYLSKTNRSGVSDSKHDYKFRNTYDMTDRSFNKNRSISQSPSKIQQNDDQTILDLLEESNNGIDQIKLLQKKLMNNTQPYGKKVKTIQEHSLRTQRNVRHSHHLNINSNMSLSQVLNEDDQTNSKSRISYSQNKYNSKQNKNKNQIGSSFNFYDIGVQDKSSIGVLDRSTIRSNNKQSISFTDKQSIVSFDKQTLRKQDKQSILSQDEYSFTNKNNSYDSLGNNNSKILSNLLQNEIFSYSKDTTLTDSSRKLPNKKLIYWK